ncbi:hypothetical protein AMJ47_03180 [Parcubacteria bacterium DG_72]|nr:MAG: hypothetical protein AMJ47_03180 [Parcubacteria bacterium DG_72]
MIIHTKEKKCPVCGKEPRDIDFKAINEEGTHKLGEKPEIRRVGIVYKCSNPDCSNPNPEKLFLVEES